MPFRPISRHCYRPSAPGRVLGMWFGARQKVHLGKLRTFRNDRSVPTLRLRGDVQIEGIDHTDTTVALAVRKILGVHTVVPADESDLGRTVAFRR